MPRLAGGCSAGHANGVRRVIALVRAALFALICACAVLPAAAQDTSNAQLSVEVYEEWNTVAQRAEDVLDAGLASNDGLETLRAQLVEWRERFLVAQDANKQRIATLREQLEVLGPKPEGDATEPDEVASRRAALDAQLTTALTPVRQAEEAYTRANGLITQLDTLVRERLAEQTLRLDPTPANPVLWPPALSALGAVGEATGTELANNYASAKTRSAFSDGLPLTLLLIVGGLVLVLRSGSWIEKSLQKIRAGRADGHARFRVGTFLASLLAVILPVVGILALIYAIRRTEITGPIADSLLQILESLVTSLAAARWMSTQVFPKVSPPAPMLPTDAADPREGRFYTIMLALLLSAQGAISVLAANPFLTAIMTIDVQSVLRLPVIAVAGLMLFRLGQILLKAARYVPPQDDDAEEALPNRTNLLTGGLGRAAIVLGVLGPIAAAIGYVTLGSMVVFSSVLTLALLALLAVLQRFVRDVYAMLLRDEAKANALVPVLIGFALFVLATPVFALIWGARSADISEAWAMFSAGFQIGGSRISPTDFLVFAVIFVLGYMLTRLLQNTLKTQILPKTQMDIGGRNAVISGVGYIGIFLAALIAITTAGIDLSGLAIVAGALSVGIGFGLQTIVSNFVSGIILLVERPISEGDWIEVGGTMGVVRDISVRATRIETFDRRDVIVPNADLISTAVVNWTKGNLTGRVIVPVGVAYGTDTRKVEAVLRDIAEAHPQVIVRPPPAVFMVGFGADSLDFEIRAILRDVNYVMSAASDMRHEIAKRFAEEGIEIPFAQRDLWLRNPEMLTAPEGPMQEG